MLRSNWTTEISRWPDSVMRSTSFLGGETLNGAKTLKVWRIRQSPSFLMINVFHYPWLNRVQANEDSLICITAELRLKGISTGSV